MSGSPIGRIVEINQENRYLSKELGFLLVRDKNEIVGRVPLEDLSAVIATSQGAVVSCALLSDLALRGVPFVVCGDNYAPTAIVWPLEGHHRQQRRMEAQVAVKESLAKSIWAVIVAAKIMRQGKALEAVRGEDGGLKRLAGLVRPGDPENREAQAARRYWALLFGGKFRRSSDEPGINGLLNYGYAILRSATARAVAAVGLHPGIGIFHRHPHNAMPLVDDLMEPFRPTVDLEVARLATAGASAVTTTAKRSLVALLSKPVSDGPGSTPLATTILRLSQFTAETYVTGALDPKMLDLLNA